MIPSGGGRVPSTPLPSGAARTAGRGAGTAVVGEFPPSLHGPGYAPVPAPSSQNGQAGPGRWPLHDHVELGALPSSVPCARRHARLALEEWDLDHLSDDALAVVSELVTNAVQAAPPAWPMPTVQLWLFADTWRLLIVVEDGSPWPPVPAGAAAAAEGGRGLMLVDALSVRWGWFPVHDRAMAKYVWAELSAGESDGSAGWQ